MNRIICGAVVPVLLTVGTDARARGLYDREFATPTMGAAGAGAAARADDAFTCYAEYYNTWRTQLGSDKDAPLTRPVHDRRRIMPMPKLGGLNHAYIQI